MFAPISDDRNLMPQQVREAYERQHGAERRFSDAKSGLQIAPVLLKIPGRIHALLINGFLAPLSEALIECELRPAITHDGNVVHADSVTLADTHKRVLNLLDIPSIPSIPSERYTDA